jgi:predicted MFS family arabinose efflux permease
MNQAVLVARAALGRPPLRRALLAFAVFSVAEWATWVAVLVWGYQRAGVDAAAVLSVVQLVPATLVAPVSSTLGDRLRRGQALALGYAAQGAAMLATAAAIRADLPFAAVAAFAALATCAITLTRPVHNAALPALSGTPEQLLAGNAASTTAEGLGSFLGPLICGLLIVSGGAESVLTLFGLLMLVAAVSVAGLPAGRGEPAQGDRLVSAALEGVRELRHDPPAAVLVGMVASQYVVVGALDILLIVFALEELGTDAAGPGLLGSALGIGSVLGGIVTVALVGRRRLSPALAGGIMATGVPLALVPLGATTLGVAVLLAVCGAGKSFFDVAARTLMQRTVPDRVLARVFGVQESLMSAAIALGSALAPAAVALWGAAGAVAATGALLPVTGAISWRWLRRLDAMSDPPGPYLAQLRATPTLRLAAVPQLERLSRDATELDVPAGARLVTEGEPGDLFYVLLDGEVVVTRHGEKVRRLGAGASFGEIALLHHSPRTATVQAVTDIRLVTVRRIDFLRTVRSGLGSFGAAEDVARTYLEADERGSGTADT